MTGLIEGRLAERSLQLPTPSSGPPGVRLPFASVRVVDGLAHVSGHGPFDGSRCLAAGKVGAEFDAVQAAGVARLVGLSMLASLRAELTDLDRITSWVRVLGFVNCAPGFIDMPTVLNGFSDLILDLWDERGVHARSAVGVAELPFGIPVEIEATLTIRP